MGIPTARDLLLRQPIPLRADQVGDWHTIKVDPTAMAEKQNFMHRGWFDDDPVKFSMLSEVMGMHFEFHDAKYGQQMEDVCSHAMSAFELLLSTYVTHMQAQLDIATTLQNKVVGAVSSLSVMAFTAACHVAW